LATQNKNLAIISDADGNQASLNFSYDDVTLLVSQISIINNTTSGAFVSAKRIDGSRTYSTTVAAGQTQTIPITSSTANRLQLTVTSSGKLDGVEWSFNLV
jgi:hypothetical protein